MTPGLPRKGPCEAFLKWTLSWAEQEPKMCGQRGIRWEYRGTVCDPASGEHRFLATHRLLCTRHSGLAMSGFHIHFEADGHAVKTLSRL